ncbi:MAG: hypothetical protein JWQ66_2127 [Mucilaginibacter sp.]|nr:hypothetical protein [Mucilaginibacter sp.]
MVYLFNSGFRSGYQINLLNTLSYPTGWVNNYRYTCTTAEAYVDLGLVDLYIHMLDEPVLIVAVDRFAAGGYVYHPIRKGVLKGCFTDGNRIIFTVVLGEYIYPINNAGFNQSLIRAFPDRPQLTGNDPSSGNDGHYAVSGTDLVGDGKNFIKNVPAWEEITEALALTHVYTARPDDETVFTRISLNILPTLVKTETDNSVSYSTVYKLIKGKDYTVSFSYKYPAQQGNATIEVNLAGRDSLRFNAGDAILLNTRSDNKTIEFAPKKFTDEKKETLRFNLTRPTTVTPFNFNSPHIALELEMSEGIDFWLQVAATTLLWVISSLLVGIDYSKVKDSSWQSIVQSLTAWKIIASFANAAILIWIFRLWGGKKPS